MKLQGTLTALATPFNADGSVDNDALDALVDEQLEAKIDGLVPCGTTGESATMTMQERAQVVERVVQRVKKRVPVIAGTGGTDTKVAIEHQKRAYGAGADITLVASPAYNKPSPDGLKRHYQAILDAVDVPILLYNVPSRTGCDMTPSILADLAKLPRIIGVKEATADLNRIHHIKKRTSQDFSILSGDDFSAFPAVCLGADGVISVTSNLMPAAMVELISLAQNGKLEAAREAHHTLVPLFDAMFIESNPIPLKAAMALRGQLSENYRLPMCPLAPENKRILKEVLSAGAWI